MLSENHNKISNAACLLSEHEHLFICPICSSPMEVINYRSLVCSNHHCFDISKQGYVNLLSRSPKTKYDKKLFESRKIIFANGLFDPMITSIWENMRAELKPTRDLIRILDAGCGEGSFLYNIQQRIAEKSKCNLLGVGIDISKEGIMIASRGSSESIWCVADLARCPFADKQFNFMLNILSPSNYSEFSRVLADDGLMIKVIPERKYLQELRGSFYQQTDRNVYSNKNTIALFQQHFELVDLQHVCYGVTLDHEIIEPLIRMTPLSWGALKERIADVLGKSKVEITFDFTVLMGKKMNK